MSEISPKIEESWKELLKSEFSSPYFIQLKNFLLQEKKSGQQVYPSGANIFAAFDFTSVEDVKVVLLGQDPYHGFGQAHGLSFSVPEGVRPPPSLQNMFKELRDDLGVPMPEKGNLQKWAKQGVLLLNATLTVRANSPGSHQKQGWENFTDAVIQKISSEKSGVVFLLWGKFAQAKEVLIDTTKHHVLKAPHPSPFSAHSGFFGCKHFSKTNAILRKQGLQEIDWSLE